MNKSGLHEKGEMNDETRQKRQRRQKLGTVTAPPVSTFSVLHYNSHVEVH